MDIPYIIVLLVKHFAMNSKNVWMIARLTLVVMCQQPQYQPQLQQLQDLWIAMLYVKTKEVLQ